MKLFSIAVDERTHEVKVAGNMSPNEVVEILMPAITGTQLRPTSIDQPIRSDQSAEDSNVNINKDSNPGSNENRPG